MAFRPLTDEDMQNVYDYGQTVLPEEKGLFDRITDDVVDTVSNYFKGAEQGWNEWQRADQNNNEVNPVTDAEYLGIGDTIEPTQEQVDAQQWNDQAASNFMHQTVEPVVMPAAIVAKGALGLAAAPFMADSAIDSYNKGGIGQVGRDLTYGGIEDVWDKRNDPEFLQQLHDRPVSTLSSVAMAAVPPILMGKGAYKGAKIGKEYLNKTVSDTVDNALNDMELGHLSPDAVTNRDIAPPVESTQPLMNALEQIKQQKFDDVENIYNDRAEQQANLTDARQGLVNALDRVNGQKYDNVENIYNDRATQQSDLTNARQGLVNALDRVNGQKFDDATQQSYWDFMKRQQEDANNLQAQKNDIAGSVLMNPADRMEVGADIPTKTRIGDPYIFDKQEPQNIMLPNQREPQNLILPEQVAEPFFKDTNTVIDQKALQRAIQNKDYATAADIADQLGNTKFADTLRNIPQTKQPNIIENPLDRQKIIQDTKDNIQKQVVEAVTEKLQPKEPTDFLGKLSKDDINYDTARRAYYAVSFDPEIRAKSVQESYVKHMTDMYNKLRKLAKTPEQKSILDAEMERYRQGYINHQNAVLAATSRTMSPMIAGPANFPVARNNKRMQTEHNRVVEFLDWDKKSQKAIENKLNPQDSGIVSSDDPKAIQKLQDKIAKAEHLHETMKQANSILRKKLTDDETVSQLQQLGLSEKTAREVLTPDFAGHKGFAQFHLQNNLANIKRMKGRVKELTERFSQDTSENEINGVKLIQNTDKNRVQLFFDGKPNVETRAELKSHGFRFSKNEGNAWQRQLTPQAVTVAKKIASRDKLYSGFDPTGGKYDKVKLSSLLDNKINNIADRMWNTEDTSIPKTKNWINEKRQTTPKSPTDYVINKFDKLYQSAIDDKHPLSKVDNELYKQARVANAAAYGQATELLTRKDADSFRNILEPIKSQTKEFSQYLEAVHSIDQQAAELKTRMTPEEAQGTVNSASPQFRQAQKQIVSYNNKLLNILVDGDVLTRDAVNAMRQKWPNYVPFMRDFSDTAAVDNFIRSKGFINVANPIKKLKGSEREVIDPLESIIKNTYIFTNIAERNKIGMTFSKLADLPGDEGVVVRLEGQHAQDPNTSTFTVWENGKKQAYRTTPELYRAMASLDKEASNFITDMLAVPAGWLRAGATLTPDFMARNLTRDAVSAFINSNGNFIPVIDTFRGLSHALKKDDLYWDWLSNGGGMSTLVSLDRVGLQAKLKDFRTKTGMEKLVTAINPKTYLEMLRTLSEYSELGTRLGVYGKDINKGMNQLDAIIDSREASIDFGRAGTKGRPLNRVIAFLNANLQDTDKLIRNLKNPATRGRTMSKITMSLVIPSIATWYIGKDDERVQRLPSWQRDLFWIVPTKMSGPGWDGLIRIPKPFGPGVLFASGTERMLDWAYKNKKDAFKGYGGSMWNAFAPGIVPTAAVPLMEWWANKSMFTGQDIVPRREQGLPDKLQFGPHTTELSKYIGGKLNVSPRKIDNTIYGYTGGLGRQVSDFGNFIMGGGKNQPATPVTQMPILRGFTATSYNNSQPVQDYYDKLKENSQKIAEYKFNNQRPDMNTQKNHDTFNKSTKVMQSLLKAERDIQTSNKLTPDQKRQKLDALQLNQVKAAEAILKKIR